MKKYSKKINIVFRKQAWASYVKLNTNLTFENYLRKNLFI